MKLFICVSLYGMGALVSVIYMAHCVTGYITPRALAEEAVDLGFPFPNGIYAIVHGGFHPSLNYHYAYPNQRYAVDIVKLNFLGQRKSKLGSSQELQDYEIYKDIVYSPVEGKVVKVVDDVEESLNRAITSNRTNMVVIEFKNYYILLLHFRPGSVKVREGVDVNYMQPIAEVGNSGISSEPHLHIHAIKKIENDDFFGAEAVPITFNGQFFKRNQIVYNQRVILR